MSTLRLGHEHKLKKQGIAQKMPFTFETPIESPKIPIMKGSYIKAELKFVLKPSGTFEIGPGAEQKSLDEWMHKFAQVLIADVEDVKMFMNAATLVEDFRADTLKQDGLTLPEIKFNLAKKEVKIAWKIQGTFQNSGIKFSAEAILLALGSDNGKLEVKPPSIELKAGKDLIVLPPIKLSDWVTAKASIALMGKLSVTPNWGAIATWLIEEGIVDLAADALIFFEGYYLVLKATYLSFQDTYEMEMAKARVPKDADLFVKGYMEGIGSVPVPDDFLGSLDEQSRLLYNGGFNYGIECQKKAWDEMSDWWGPLKAGGKTPYRDWLDKNGADLEKAAKPEAFKQARRAAWAAYNERKSPSPMNQQNWWIFVYGMDPRDAGEIDVFQQYAKHITWGPGWK